MDSALEADCGFVRQKAVGQTSCFAPLRNSFTHCKKSELNDRRRDCRHGKDGLTLKYCSSQER